MIPPLFLYLRASWDNKKTKTLILQAIKERLANEMVLISRQERILLGDLMKDFTEQPGKFANSSNNVEGNLAVQIYKSNER